MKLGVVSSWSFLLEYYGSDDGYAIVDESKETADRKSVV